MELLEEAETAARLLAALPARRGRETFSWTRGAEAIHLSVLRRPGRARVVASYGAACAKLRLPWNYSESELHEALVRVYLLAVRRYPTGPWRVHQKARSAVARGRRASEAAALAQRAVAAERARHGMLEHLMRERLHRREVERSRARAAIAAPTIVQRVLRVLGRQKI